MLALFNQMYNEGIIRDQQKHGLVVCIPKKTVPTQAAGYRPITLLNTDCKILACIIANRLRPILDELLHPSQHCGVAGRGIFEAVATIRDSIAYAEMPHVPLCILSLDFTEAFETITHMYLFRLLTKYGFSTKFTALIENMYNHAHSSIYINGHTTGPIPIQCFVRHGCLMSLLLFALSLNPLLTLRDQKITGITIGRRTRTAVVAYADDITLQHPQQTSQECVKPYRPTKGQQLPA